MFSARVWLATVMPYQGSGCAAELRRSPPQNKLMTHEDWLKEIKQSLDLRRENKRSQARKLLQSLLRRANNGDSGLDAWHESEATSLIALLFEEEGNIPQAAKYHLKGAESHKGWYIYHSQAAAQRIARASLCFFQMGKTAKAVRLADQALKLNALNIDPSPVYEELIQKLRKYHEDRAARKQRR